MSRNGFYNLFVTIAKIEDFSWDYKINQSINQLFLSNPNLSSKLISKSVKNRNHIQDLLKACILNE